MITLRQDEYWRPVFQALLFEELKPQETKDSDINIIEVVMEHSK